MYTLKFVVFSVLFVTFAKNILCSEEEERVRAIYSKCRDETQIEENELETFRRMELPTSGKGKCMMGCLMREANIIVNGRFHKDGAIQVAERYYTEKPDELEKAKTVIGICETEIEGEIEECEIAGKLATCVIDEAQKVNSTMSIDQFKEEWLSYNEEEWFNGYANTRKHTADIVKRKRSAFPDESETSHRRQYDIQPNEDEAYDSMENYDQFNQQYSYENWNTGNQYSEDQLSGEAGQEYGQYYDDEFSRGSQEEQQLYAIQNINDQSQYGNYYSNEQPVPGNIFSQEQISGSEQFVDESGIHSSAEEYYHTDLN